jgi:adenylate cyclase
MRRFASLLKQKVSLNTIARVGIGLVLVLVFMLGEGEIYQLDFTQRLEQQSYDARVKLSMPGTMDPRIVIIDIDEKTLANEGRWPLARDKWATLVHQLFERYRIRVLGFDVAFPEPDTSSGLPILDRLAKGDLRDDAAYQAFIEKSRSTLDYDQLFATEIAKYPVVLGFFLSPKQDRTGVLPLPVYQMSSFADKKDEERYRYTRASGFSGNLPQLQKSAAAAGHLSPGLDIDGVTRRVPMFMRVDNGLYEAMSLAVTRMYLGNVPIKARTDSAGSGEDKINWVTEIDLGGHRIPLDDSMAALVPFRGPHPSFRYISATDVIRGTLPADDLVDKIAIVGTSAQGLLDIRTTPVGEDYPGVEVHANMISGILDNSIRHRPPEAEALNVLTVILLGLPLAFFLPRLTALGSTLATIGALALLFAVNMFSWQKGYILSIAAPAMMVVMLYFINMAYGFFMEARSRQLITGLFGTYVPKELVAEMAKNPEEYSMQGESRVMTVLFSDVRDFTSISEGLSAEQLKDMMNAYLSEMTEVIQHQRGTIDKYIGDAIMAFWGAPLADADHAAHAVGTALDMQKRIRGLDDAFIKQGWPLLNIGVGLNCGEMNVGDMGSKFRRAYTVMGDAVNIASRLEGLTKEYGIGILVSEGIVQTAPGFVYREIDRAAVKGRTEGIAIYEPMGRVGEVVETQLQEIDRWHKSLEHYRKQRWDDAEALLKTLSFAAPESKLYKVYLKRIQHFRATTPGPTWNGLWVFTTK